MKKLIKVWDIILIAVLGLFGSGCILDPPAPEYGVEPMYGVASTIQDSDTELQEQHAEELQ